MELIEFDWNEQTGESLFTFENDRTGELVTKTKHQPLAKPFVTEELKQEYFKNLRFWLTTQPLYD